MAVKDLHGNRSTPKEFAKQVFRVDLDIVEGFWEERWEDQIEDMTPRELDQVRNQIDKIARRIYRMVSKKV